MENIDQIKLIVEGCLRKDRRSQEAFFKMFYGKMMSVCLRYISDRDSAQEVLQDGFIKVFDKLEHFDFRGSIDGWLRRIISNTAIDAIRKAKRNPFLTDNDNDFKQLAENELEKKDNLIYMELKAKVAMDEIQKLSPAYRTVFNLYVFEEYSHKEISEILGISEGTSKSNLSKAKVNLQNRLSIKFSKIEE
ncbi:MAG: RNA polymerase sigma factor [Flavobacteriia bacterium]|nr:RNA polymerase sigma factor [Flavobacteriia bacterium]